MPDGPADQLDRRDHVETVEQAEPAQKPFCENGIGLGRAEREDRFESEGLELQRAVAQAYEEIAKIASDRVVVVDGTGTVEDVHERVMEAVRARAAA